MQESLNQTNEPSDSYLEFLNKLSHVSELVSLFILLIPLIFVSKLHYLFAALALLVLLAISLLVKYSNFLQNELQIKIPALICLGLTGGLLQLDPVPLICLFLLVIVSLANFEFITKVLCLVGVFFIGLTSYFISSLLFSATPTNNNVFVNVAAVFTLFITLTVKMFSWQYRYSLLSDGFHKSKNRFELFMKLSNKLAKYVPEQVWREVVQEKRDVLVENKRRKLTVFFSDIKGFTDLSESMSAEDLSYFLNEYFESMSAIAKKHGATIDKFVGDALMIFFGDPESKGEREDAIACVEMAVDMNRELARLRNYWLALGFEGIHVRMGINTGYCHVGNFGSANRVSYTAIGREVNLAARIQDAARPNSIFISDTTYELIKHRFLCQKGVKAVLKGIKEPVQLWEVRRHRQGDEIKDARWIEFDLSGFHLHINMLNIKSIDKKNIRDTLVKASRVMDESLKKEKNQLK